MAAAALGSSLDEIGGEESEDTDQGQASGRDHCPDENGDGESEDTVWGQASGRDHCPDENGDGESEDTDRGQASGRDHCPDENGDGESEVEVYTEQTEFLNAVHREVLNLVYPVESGLVDEMRCCSIFTSDEEQRISAKVTRRDRARRFWKTLHKVPPIMFEKHCFPALQTICPLAVRGKVFKLDAQGSSESYCFRHLMQTRMTLKRFADIFPTTKSCTYQEYSKMTEDSDMDEALWNEGFQICSRNHNNEAFKDALTRTLESIRIELPANFQPMLAAGFPCTCRGPLPVTRARKRKLHFLCEEVNFWHGENIVASAYIPLDIKLTKKGRGREGGSGKESSATRETCAAQVAAYFPGYKSFKPLITERERRKVESSCGYPSSLDMSHDAEWDSVSMLSSEAKKAAETEEEQAAPFDTAQQKDNALEQIKLINKAIIHASQIKPLFREVSGIDEELAVLKEETKSESSAEPQWRIDGTCRRLQERVWEIRRQLRIAFEEACRHKKQVEDLGPMKGLPFKYNKILLTRKQVLENEMKEATPFFGQSVTVCRKHTNYTRATYTMSVFLRRRMASILQTKSAPDMPLYQ